MILGDRETKIALQRGRIGIHPLPPDSAFSTTSVDPTLAFWLGSRVPRSINPKGRPAADCRKALPKGSRCLGPPLSQLHDAQPLVRHLESAGLTRIGDREKIPDSS
jgi:hypothetical protein